MITFRLFKGLIASCLWFPWIRGDDGQQATRGATVKSVSTQVLVKPEYEFTATLHFYITLHT